MENYYEILEIDRNAEPEEIKKAYRRLLRKFPPEKEEKRYQKIREAYDTLRDEKSRKNYDAYFLYEKELKSLEENIEEALKRRNYEEARKLSKKALIIAPEVAHFKFKLALINFLDGNYQNSLKDIQDLHKEYPENIEYIILLARVYEKLGKNSEYYKYLKEAYNLDPKNSTPINLIVDYYLSRKEINLAIKFLNDEINRDNSIDFEDFFALFKLLECYVVKLDLDGLRRTLNTIKKVIPEDEETKRYISWKLAGLAFQIYKAGTYHKELLRCSLEIIEFSKELVILSEEESKGINMLHLLIKSTISSIEKHEYNQYRAATRSFSPQIDRLQAANSRPSEVPLLSEGCYIATAVYGDYNAEEVIVLRKFRDKILRKYYLGRKFIKFYYKYSPNLAQKIKLGSFVSNFSKKILDRFVSYLRTRV